MTNVEISKVEAGSFLARDVVTLRGKVLFKEGTVLTEEVISDIVSKLGNSFVVCVDTYKEVKLKISQSGVVASRYVDLILNQLSAYMNVAFRRGESIIDISDKLAGYLIKHRDTLQELILIKYVHNYTYNHCLNVAIIACQIGVELGLTESEINALVLGSLLHDLGKVDIPVSILDKPSKLSDAEFYTIKKHPQLGCDLLKDIDIDNRSFNIVIQHHEKLDGSGYPNKLRSQNINDLSRIVAIADIFDALTSERAYHKPMAVHKALVLLKRDSENGKLDDLVVEKLCSSVVVYPPNTFLQLSNGMTGFVVDSGVDNKPVIFDTIHRRYFNLAKHPEVQVVI